MRQVMSARQAFECYVSDVNKGSQFLHAHFHERYGDVKCFPVFIGDDHCIFQLTPCVSKDGVDIVDAIRSSKALDEIDGWLNEKSVPRMAHAGSMYESETHSYRMIFKKCNMSKADVKKYLKLFGVE